MNFKKWLKKITYNEGRPPPMSLLDIWRAVLHCPVGAFACWFIYVFPVAGTVFAFGFLTYEVVEDWRIKDRGYKDIFGFLAGMAIMGIVLFFV